MEEDLPNNKCVSLKVLQAYKNNTLEPKKRKNVEAHLSTCQLCEYTLASLGGIDEKELAEDLAILKTNFSKKLPKNTLTKKRRSLPIYQMAAALLFLITIGFGIQFFNNQNTPNQLFQQYYQAYEVPDALIKGTQENSPTISPPLAAAIADYTNIPYENTRQDRPTQFSQDRHEMALTQLLNGLTALKKDDIAIAIQLLKKVEKSNTKFSEDAMWYLALAHLKLEAIPKTNSYLDEILQLENGVYFEEARALKKELKK